MDGIVNLSSFIIAGIILNLTPGQDTLYILGRSIANGRKAGVISVLGISSGAVVHTLAAAFGLSAILMSCSIAFSIIKYAGAAYLVYLGIKMVVNRSGKSELETGSKTESSKLSAIYKQAMLTNLLNPKVAVFFLAFLPQFIDPSRAQGPLPFLFLGAVFITTGTIWCLIVASGSALLTNTLRSKPVAERLMKKISGGVFVLLGLKLAFEES